MKCLVLLTALVSAMALGAGAAYAVRDDNATTIAVDEKSETIRFLAGGKEIARIDADGLHATGNVSYTGMMTDTGSAVRS